MSLLLEKLSQLDIDSYKLIRGKNNQFGFDLANKISHSLIAEESELLLNPDHMPDEKPQVYDGGQFIYTGDQIRLLNSRTDSCNIVTETGNIVGENDMLEMQKIRRNSAQALANLLVIEVLAYIPFSDEKESFQPQLI